MDFSFSSDQQLLKNSARAFLDEHCKPAAVRLLWDDPRGESDTMWKEMAQLGWLGLSLPEAYGGSALGMVEPAEPWRWSEVRLVGGRNAEHEGNGKQAVHVTSKGSSGSLSDLSRGYATGAQHAKIHLDN